MCHEWPLSPEITVPLHHFIENTPEELHQSLLFRK